MRAEEYIMKKLRVEKLALGEIGKICRKLSSWDWIGSDEYLQKSSSSTAGKENLNNYHFFAEFFIALAEIQLRRLVIPE